MMTSDRVLVFLAVSDEVDETTSSYVPVLSLFVVSEWTGEHCEVAERPMQAFLVDFFLSLCIFLVAYACYGPWTFRLKPRSSSELSCTVTVLAIKPSHDSALLASMPVNSSPITVARVAASIPAANPGPVMMYDATPLL